MNSYLLDTNVVSELRRTRPHGAVAAWFRDLKEEQLFISAVTMGEIQVGIERARRQDASKAGEIERWAEQIAGSFKVLVMDAPCFREWGRLMDRKPEGWLEDAMIAAIARVHHLIVAIRNERDFEQLEARIFNPFKN